MGSPVSDLNFEVHCIQLLRKLAKHYNQWRNPAVVCVLYNDVCI